MNTKHKQILERIFDHPIQSNIIWKDVENMLKALGANVSEGRGSRVRIVLNDARAVFHRPHPQKETNKGAVRSMQRFLIQAGVNCHDDV